MYAPFQIMMWMKMRSWSRTELLNARKQFALPAPSIMAFPSTTGTQLALSASTSHSFTEPVVVSVHQSADCIKYLEGTCLNFLMTLSSIQIQTCLTATQTNQKNPTIFSNCQFTINFIVSNSWQWKANNVLSNCFLSHVYIYNEHIFSYLFDFVVDFVLMMSQVLWLPVTIR